MSSNTTQHARLSVRLKDPTIVASSAVEGDEETNSIDVLAASTTPPSTEPEELYSATDDETDEEPESDSDDTADEAADAPDHHGPNPNASTQAPPVPQVPTPAPAHQSVRIIITVHFIRHHRGAVLSQPFPIEAGTAVTMRRLWYMVQLFRYRPDDPETAFLKRKPTTWRFSVDANTNTGMEKGFEARCLQDADPDRVYAEFGIDWRRSWMWRRHFTK